jgi:hypothetical protein
VALLINGISIIVLLVLYRSHCCLKADDYDKQPPAKYDNNPSPPKQWIHVGRGLSLYLDGTIKLIMVVAFSIIWNISAVGFIYTDDLVLRLSVIFLLVTFVQLIPIYGLYQYQRMPYKDAPDVATGAKTGFYMYVICFILNLVGIVFIYNATKSFGISSISTLVSVQLPILKLFFYFFFGVALFSLLKSFSALDKFLQMDLSTRVATLYYLLSALIVLLYVLHMLYRYVPIALYIIVLIITILINIMFYIKLIKNISDSILQRIESKCH